MSDWQREEWLAARNLDEHRPHPPGCTCPDCAAEEVPRLTPRALSSGRAPG